MREVSGDATTGPTDGDVVTVVVSRRDFVTFSHTLAVAIEAVDEWEFHARAGVDKDVAVCLLIEVGEVLGRSGAGEVLVELSGSELVAMANSITESFEALRAEGVASRTGVPVVEVRRLHRRVRDPLDGLRGI